MNQSVHDLMSLKNRYALITGGAGHVGKMAADTLAQLGASIFLVDRDKAALDAFAESLVAAYDIEVYPMVADLEDLDAVASIASYVKQQSNQLHILINNAAFVGSSDLSGWVGPLAKQSIATWERALRVNLTAPFALAQAFEPLLTAAKGASIINIGSIYGIVGPHFELYKDLEMGNPAAYAASKGGLIQLTRWLAAAMAPAIRVNALSPGGIWRDQAEAFVERYAANTLLERMAREKDLQGAITYLASDLSAYVTGQNLIVDGGWTAT
ncbi:MAG: SDR family oxidoreductase [Gammaproteobacteria bacterium]|nr:SDR family oxidoreductase [Gammaproteobacteria bacterium]